MKFYDWYRQIIRNPKYRWWVIIGSLVYVLSPIDLLPDIFLPIVGEIDDLIVATLLVSEISQMLIERVKSTKGGKAEPSVQSETGEARTTTAAPVDVNAVQVD